MRLVVWNMAANTVSRDASIHGEAWRHLANLAPDLALLQEARTPPGWVSDRWTVGMGTVRRWGSAILAKPSLGFVQHPGPPDGSMEADHLLATGTVTFVGASLLVGSVHAPVGVARPADLNGRDPGVLRRDWHRRDPPQGPYLVDVAYDIYRSRVVGRRFLLGGDWNMSRRWDRGHMTESADFFARAMADGWVDVCCPDGREGRTWYRTGQRGYQMDHVFCDPSTAALVRSVHIDAEPAAGHPQLSDHAPLVVDLAP